MNKKHNTLTKVLSLVLALILVVGASVAGTLAWLTAKTEKVENTFASAKLFDEDGSITLWEHKVEDTDGDGRYELMTGEANETDKNEYKVLPGVNIPKDPTVDIVDLKEKAYLYIKVTDALADDMSYAIDDAKWEALNGYTDIWTYKDGVIGPAELLQVTILKNNEVVVDGAYSADNGGSLTFEAYLVQATGNGSNAAEAWANTYGASGSNG